MPSPKEAPSAANGERRSFMRKHVWAISIRRTFRVLQRFIAALARTDAHHTLYIIDEYLSVADMTREERLRAASTTVSTGTLLTTTSTLTLGSRSISTLTPR